MALQDDDRLATPEKGAAQAHMGVSPQVFLEQDATGDGLGPGAHTVQQGGLVWGAAQGLPAQSLLGGYPSPTALSMELTGGSLEGSEYSSCQGGQEDLSRLLGATMLDTAGSIGVHGQPHPLP